MNETSAPARVVVTGGAGALGRALVRTLREARPTATIRVLNRSPASVPGAPVEPCDVRTADFGSLLRGGEVVYHLAAWVHRMPRTPEEVREVHEVNHAATARLAAACLDIGATLVAASTVAVSASSEYGRSKAAGEEAVRALGARGLRFSIVRFPLLYGPHGRGNMERMLSAIRTGRYWPVGDPATPKSCLYVDDAARALLLAAEMAPGQTHTAAPVPATTLGEIHSAAYAAAGRTLPPFAVPRRAALAAAGAIRMALRVVGRETRLPEQIETLTAPAGADGGPFARATGFRAEVGLVEGLRRTEAWMAEHAP